jgi:hypothetical protein
VAYTPEVVFAGGVPVIIKTLVQNDFQVTGAQVEAAITPKTKVILIGYPNNPTGAVMTRERLLDIAQLAAKRSDRHLRWDHDGWCMLRCAMANNFSIRVSPRCPACATAPSCWVVSPSRTR